MFSAPLSELHSRPTPYNNLTLGASLGVALGTTLGVALGVGGKPPKRSTVLEPLFENWGGPRTPDFWGPMKDVWPHFTHTHYFGAEVLHSLRAPVLVTDTTELISPPLSLSIW